MNKIIRTFATILVFLIILIITIIGARAEESCEWTARTCMSDLNCIEGVCISRTTDQNVKNVCEGTTEMITYANQVNKNGYCANVFSTNIYNNHTNYVERGTLLPIPQFEMRDICKPIEIIKYVNVTEWKQNITQNHTVTFTIDVRKTQEISVLGFLGGFILSILISFLFIRGFRFKYKKCKRHDCYPFKPLWSKKAWCWKCFKATHITVISGKNFHKEAGEDILKRNKVKNE